jgi:beta-xylosidase
MGGTHINNMANRCKDCKFYEEAEDMELVEPANQDYHKVTGYCECGNYFECTYIGDYYYLTCSKCGSKYTNESEYSLNEEMIK